MIDGVKLFAVVLSDIAQFAKLFFEK